MMLGIFTALSATLAIAAAPWAFDQPLLAFVFKPLTTILLIVYAAMRGADAPAVRGWVVAGLVLSLIGDIALLWPHRGFLTGLGAFLLAHLCYLRAFTRQQRLAVPKEPFIVWWLFGALALGLMWGELPVTLRWPVLAYGVCLVTMAAQASVIWRAGLPRGPLLAVGGALFVVSDTLLALNRFVTPVPLSSLMILGTYWAAQWCIASWLAPPAAATTAGSPPAR